MQRRCRMWSNKWRIMWRWMSRRMERVGLSDTDLRRRCLQWKRRKVPLTQQLRLLQKLRSERRRRMLQYAYWRSQRFRRCPRRHLHRHLLLRRSATALREEGEKEARVKMSFWHGISHKYSEDWYGRKRPLSKINNQFDLNWKRNNQSSWLNGNFRFIWFQISAHCFYCRPFRPIPAVLCE